MGGIATNKTTTFLVEAEAEVLGGGYDEENIQLYKSHWSNKNARCPNIRKCPNDERALLRAKKKRIIIVVLRQIFNVNQCHIKKKMIASKLQDEMTPRLNCISAYKALERLNNDRPLTDR